VICYFADTVTEFAEKNTMAQGKSWQRLNWQDPFLLEQQLTDEQRMVRASAHQYAHE